MLDQIAQLCHAYFLCQFDPKSRKRLTQDVVREVAQKVFSQDLVNEFIDYHLAQFQATLVEEFNQRLEDKRPLRFQIADDGGVGKIVAGYQRKKLSREIRFQNSLHRTSETEFEMLAAIVLRVLGCQDVFSTPLSHDQGVDAFGYQNLVHPTPYGVTHGLTWVAQAKHYRATKLTTRDVRELVGSKEFLVAKVFSTVDERYKELILRSHAPIAVALITTEEIPTTVRRLADRAGVFIFASSDLFYLLGPSLKKKYTVAAVRALIRKEASTIRKLT
jgi:hypothetical protein